MVERNKKIAGHLELKEIKDVMKEYKDSYDMYRKLLVISMVYQGETISQAFAYVHTSRKTGERWVKNYNEKGLKGLYSNYHNCGRKAKLSNEQLAELKEIITSSDESYTIDDVQKLIKERYGVNHDYKTVWTIVRKKLGLNYGKPFIKYSERPKDAEEQLKKNLENIDMENEFLVILDETACQNTPNTSRVLYESGNKNVIAKIPDRIKINMIGFQSINCKSYVEATEKSNAYTFLISLCKFRILNMENEIGQELLMNAINNPNLLEENIKKELSKESSSEYELINKINDKLYDDNSKQKSLESIRRICNKEDLNNKTKIEYRKRKNLNENLENPKIKELLSKEKKINIVLDNAKIHSAKMVLNAAKTLNINLIFLSPYSPDLSPIEDVWRVIKKTIYKTMYNTKNELIKLFEDKYYEIIDSKSFYENWLDQFSINF